MHQRLHPAALHFRIELQRTRALPPCAFCHAHHPPSHPPTHPPAHAGRRWHHHLSRQPWAGFRGRGQPWVPLPVVASCLYDWPWQRCVGDGASERRRPAETFCDRGASRMQAVLPWPTPSTYLQVMALLQKRIIARCNQLGKPVHVTRIVDTVSSYGKAGGRPNPALWRAELEEAQARQVQLWTPGGCKHAASHAVLSRLVPNAAPPPPPPRPHLFHSPTPQMVTTPRCTRAGGRSSLLRQGARTAPGCVLLLLTARVSRLTPLCLCVHRATALLWPLCCMIHVCMHFLAPLRSPFLSLSSALHLSNHRKPVDTDPLPSSLQRRLMWPTLCSTAPTACAWVQRRCAASIRWV